MPMNAENERLNESQGDEKGGESKKLRNDSFDIYQGRSKHMSLL